MNTPRRTLVPARQYRSNPATNWQRPRAILSAVMIPASVFLAGVLSVPAHADSIFAPGNPILGGQLQSTNFVIGNNSGAGGQNDWPAAEPPTAVIDGTTAKYLNFAHTNTGFIVDPSYNAGTGSVVTSIQLWTANDSENRDPATYQIYGTNTVFDLSGAVTTFALSSFTSLASGALSLPTARNNAGTLTNSQTVTFTNTVAYKEYLIIFPTVKDVGGTANSMQIGEVQLFGTAPVASLIWAGTGAANGNLWDIATNANWTSGGSAATFTNTSSVQFDDTAANTSVSVPAAVQPTNVTFQNSTKNYTVSGSPVTASGVLVVSGTGSVTLNNANTYAGALVSGGTLTVSNTGSLNTSALTINNANAGAGTNVAVNFATAQSIGTLSGAVGTPSSGTNTATLTIGGLLTVNQTAPATFQGTITGTAGLTKSGNATLTLTGTNTYAGPTIVNAGTLASSAPGDFAQGALPANQPVTVNSGATLLFGADDGLGYHAGQTGTLTVNGGTVTAATGTHSTLPAVVLNGGTIAASGLGNGPSNSNYILDAGISTPATATTASSITAPIIRLRGDLANTGTGTPVVFNILRGSAASDLIVNSSIQDTGFGLTKTGNGILVLQSPSSYSGPTAINAGTVVVRHAAAFGASEVTMNGGTISFAPIGGTVSGFSGFTSNGGATIDGTNNLVTLTDGGGSEARSVFSNAKVITTNGFTANFTYTANGGADGMTFTIQNSAPTALGAAGGGLGYLGIAKSSALEFNLYTGGGQPVGTAFSSTGTTGTYVASTPVVLNSTNPIGVTVVYDPAAQTLAETLVDGANTYTNTFANVNIAAAVGNDGYIGFTGGTGGVTSTQTVQNFTFNNVPAPFAVANNFALPDAATAGLEILPLASGAQGAVTLQGTLSMGVGATLNVTGGATATNLDYTLTAANATVLNGDATFNVANNGTGTGNLVLSTVSGVGNAGLTKTGAGTLTLPSGGTSIYFGATKVNGGKLVLNGTLSGSVATVNSGGTLAGSGSMDGTVTVASGGTIAPGTGIGTLSTGAVTFQAGANFSIDVGTSTADTLAVAGTASLTGTTNLQITLAADPSDNTAFTILDGTAPLSLGSSRFNYQGTTLNQGTVFVVNSGGFTQAFSISYTADSNHDVVLTAVPEPGTAATLLAGLGCLVGLRRRRR